MEKTSYRTGLPFQDGLNPTTDLSRAVPMFGDYPSIEEIVVREKHRDGTSNFNDMHARGNWGDGEDTEKNYIEDGDQYMLPQKIEEIIKRMRDHGGASGDEQWVAVDVNNKPHVFPSQEMANRKMREKGIVVKRIVRVPPRTAQADLVAMLSPSCVKIEATSADGGGEVGAAFCVAPGIFATCAHCVKKYDKLGKNINPGSVEIIISSSDNRSVGGKLLAYDSEKDMAFVSAPVDCAPLEIAGPKDARPGDEVIIIGSPLGFENNVSEGIVGGVNRTVFSFPGAPRYVFTDARVLPGNSGGPMILKKNRMVAGMLSIIISPSGMYGLNAAIQAEYLQEAIKKLGGKS